MTQLKPLRVPVPAILLFSALILACGSTQESSYHYSSESSTGSGYTPPATTYTPPPSGPTFPSYIPELDRSKPPDYPKTAAVTIQYNAPAKPNSVTFFQDLVSKWNVGAYRGTAEPFVNDSFDFGGGTAILVAEGKLTYNSDGSSTRAAHGLAILTFDSSRKSNFSGTTVSSADAYILGFGYMRDGFMHGPWWFNDVEYARSGRSGGQVDYIGEYQDNRANGEFRWFDGGFLNQRAWCVNGEMHGTLTRWNATHTFQKNMVNGKDFGLYEYWDASGRLTYRSQRYGDRYYGKWESWDPAGNPPYQTGYSDLGADRGWRTAYNAEGKLMLQAWTENGVDNGPYVWYAPEGYKQWEGQRVNGKHHGLFKRFTAAGFNDFDSMHVDGAQTGAVNWYHASGKVSKEGTFAAGKEHGRFTSYREDGTISIVADYKDGQVHGEWIEYDIDGTVVIHDIYENGQWVTSTLAPTWPEPIAVDFAVERNYGRWRIQTQEDGLPALSGLKLAWSEALRGAVLFGGVGTSGLSNQTWVRRSGKWERLFAEATGPSARSGHTMAYDTARDVIVLFGGNDGSSSLADTWELSSSGWQRIQPSQSPPALAGAGMAYDSNRGVCVLFGGRTTETSSATWEWNGETWIRRTDLTAPSARSHHAMAYDAARGAVVAHGGLGSNGASLGDTLAYDGTRWSTVFMSMESDTSVAAHHEVVFDSRARRLVLLARDIREGEDYGFKAQIPDYGIWDQYAWFTDSRVGPAMRWSYGACFDQGTGEVVVYGGYDDMQVTLAETLVLTDVTPDDLSQDDKEFVERSLTVPGWAWTDNGDFTRQSVLAPSVVYDPQRGVAVMFGGSSIAHGNSNTTREFADGKWTVKQPAESPPARYGPMTWFDETRGKVMLMGGHVFDDDNKETPLSDLWEWDGRNWSRLRESTPGAPGRVAAWSYDSKRGVIVAFETASRKLMEFNGTSWKSTEVSVPEDVMAGRMVFDAGAGKVVYTHALRKGEFKYDDRAWAWDGKYWEESKLSMPLDLLGVPPQLVGDAVGKALWTVQPGLVRRWKDGAWMAWRAPRAIGAAARAWVDTAGRLHVHGTVTESFTTRNDTLVFDPELGELQK